MTKEELVYRTLNQLSESLKVSPENFRLEDSSVAPANGSFPGPTIIWQFRVQVDEDKYLIDPLNSVKTVIVTYNQFTKQLSCFIYNKEINTFNQLVMPEAQVMIEYSQMLPSFCYRTYRQFMSMRANLIKMRRNKEYVDYMKRLNSIFPTTHEEDIFK